MNLESTELPPGGRSGVYTRMGGANPGPAVHRIGPATAVPVCSIVSDRGWQTVSPCPNVPARK